MIEYHVLHSSGIPTEANFCRVMKANIREEKMKKRIVLPYISLFVMILLLALTGCTKRRPELKDVTAWAPSGTETVTLPTVVVPTPLPTVAEENANTQPQPTRVAVPTTPPTLPPTFPTATPWPESETHIYLVQAGDTLSIIAQKEGTTVALLKQLNGLTSDQITVGQSLRVPGKANAQATAQPAGQYRTYKVQSGDTLTSIAAQFGTTTNTIIQLNDIRDPNSLYVGQVLKLPPLPPSNYVVKAGDTLSSIAAHYGVTVDAIMAANHLQDPNMLYVGQNLTIPEK